MVTRLVTMATRLVARVKGYRLHPFSIFRKGGSGCHGNAAGNHGNAGQRHWQCPAPTHPVYSSSSSFQLGLLLWQLTGFHGNYSSSLFAC